MNKTNSNQEDALNDLLSGARQRAAKNRQPASEAPQPSSKSEGLKPSDILFLPESQKKLVNHLSHKLRARLKDLQHDLADMERQEILEALSALKDAGFMKELLQNGEVYYYIKFADKDARRIKGNLPKELHDSFNLDNVAFLRNLPLFNNLTDAGIDLIHKSVKQERYERNDVILWQGESAKAFFVIKSGVVAVTNLLHDGTSNLLTYLERDDFFGESALLTGQTLTATITAFTPVETLVLKKKDFYALLLSNSETAVELARTLARRLSNTNARLAANQRDATNLFVVISANDQSGSSAIASAMALVLASSTKKSTAYIEFPQQDVPSMFGFSADMKTYSHPGGYQVLNPPIVEDLPQLAQIALITDQAISNFNNIIVCVSWDFAEQLEYLIRGASEIIVVASPSQEVWKRVANITAAIKSQIQTNKTRLFVVANHNLRNAPQELAGVNADFELPFLGDLPALSEQRSNNLPEPLARIISEILNLRGFTNQIGIYIPTTIGADQQADTTPYVEKTLAFMGKIFGGATHEQTQGVWNSNDAGLVAESIHLVKSFCTQSMLDNHMGEIVDYVETLKQELQQEAMALEVNQKLMLI